MKIKYLTSLLLFLLVMPVSKYLKAAEVLAYSAEYTAKSSGLSATAKRNLIQLGDSHFRLENELTLKVVGATLGSVLETSEFNWSNDQLLPIQYDYIQSGISRKRESVEFDWNNRVAQSTEDDESLSLQIEVGNTDKLSYQFLLQQQLLQQEDQKEFIFNLVDTDEIDTHLYRVVGSEIIDTEMGKLNTVKVERVRAEGSRRSTTFWLAVDWNMLLVKFVQTNSSGSVTELLLEKAEVGGEIVTALP